LPFAIGRVCKYRIYLVFQNTKHSVICFWSLTSPKFYFFIETRIVFFGNNFVFVNQQGPCSLSFFSIDKHWLQPHLVWHNQRYLKLSFGSIFHMERKIVVNIVLLGTLIFCFIKIAVNQLTQALSINRFSFF
jgi:hypothetical protein